MEVIVWLGTTALELITNEVFAVYLIGFLGFGFTIRQLVRSLKLSKKSAVFDDLSKAIQKASQLANDINRDTNAIINALANAADSTKAYDPADKSEEQQEAEINRRIQLLEELKSPHEQYLNTIYTTNIEILALIKKIEKSTIVKEKSRKAARYLFYTTQEQYELLEAASRILQTLHVVPPIGQAPNISAESFTALTSLISIINKNNVIISGYLNDLEIILHNDLVKDLYGKAKIESIPVKHLTGKGFKDSRVESSLL